MTSGVAVGTEGVAQGAQLLAQFEPVVNLAIIHDTHLARGVEHGLAAALGQIEDTEAIVAEIERRLMAKAQGAVLVGAAVRLDGDHPADERRVRKT